ncbi:hypothetical protein WA158_005354 [Blastocystis sp. Blastoise]
MDPKGYSEEDKSPISTDLTPDLGDVRKTKKPGPRPSACLWCGNTQCFHCQCPGYAKCDHPPGTQCIRQRYKRRLVCNPCEKAKLKNSQQQHNDIDMSNPANIKKTLSDIKLNRSISVDSALNRTMHKNSFSFKALIDTAVSALKEEEQKQKNRSPYAQEPNPILLNKLYNKTSIDEDEEIGMCLDEPAPTLSTTTTNNTTTNNTTNTNNMVISSSTSTPSIPIPNNNMNNTLNGISMQGQAAITYGNSQSQHSSMTPPPSGITSHGTTPMSSQSYGIRQSPSYPTIGTPAIPNPAPQVPPLSSSLQSYNPTLYSPIPSSPYPINTLPPNQSPIPPNPNPMSPYGYNQVPYSYSMNTSPYPYYYNPYGPNPNQQIPPSQPPSQPPTQSEIDYHRIRHSISAQQVTYTNTNTIPNMMYDQQMNTMNNKSIQNNNYMNTPYHYKQ